MEGGVFDSTELYDVRCVRRANENAGNAIASAFSANTDFYIARAELVFAWRWPWLERPEKSWLRRLTIEGLSGTCDLTPLPQPDRPAPIWQIAKDGGWKRVAETIAQRWVVRGTQALAREIGRVDGEWIPENADVRADRFTLARKGYRLHAEALRLEALQDEAGWFAARGAEVSGPQFASALPAVSGWTYWKESSLTLGDVDLGRGIYLAHATLNGAHLDRRRLDWDGELTALGGIARGQGAINFSKSRLTLEIAGSLERMAVPPLAKLLGVTGETGGEVQQANFTFRGDPENWAAAEMWLTAEATDFRWGQRRWESLELRGLIINRRVQVRRLELRQSRNQLSFTGECALPAAADAAGAVPALAAANWWQSEFSCNIDARVNDLHALAQLAGGRMPELSGRMSVNGTLSAHSGAPGIDGYLNVEGSSLSIRGAPLDYLHTTLLFKGDELNVPDLQATRGGDYLTGSGTVQIIGSARYKAELHASIRDLSVYAAAYADLPFSPKPVNGSLTLDWSGDGAPGANSGAFQGTAEHFFTTSGPAALARPIDLAADGTYSPESVSFRHLVLKEGAGEKRHDALKLEGALPWTRDPQSFAAGRWLDPDRPMSIRLECAEMPLDLLAGLAPGAIAGADGQVTGWLNADGTLRAPKLDADLKFINASLRPVGASPAVENINARVRLEKSVMHIDQAKGQWRSNTVDVSGNMDLTDTAKIGLDLTVHGDDAAGVHHGVLNAGLDYALTLRGPADGFSIAGEVNLLGGQWQRPIVVAYDAAPVADWLDLAQRLPAGWGDRPIDLHVTATPPLRIAGSDAAAGISLDLQVAGTAQAPSVAGEVVFHEAPMIGESGWHGIADGTWYYSGDQPGNPAISMSARDAAGTERFLYGTAAAGQVVTAPGAVGSLPWSEPGAMAAFASGL